MCKIDGTVRELCYYDFVKSAEAIAMQIKHSLGIDNGDTSSLRDRFIAIYLKRDIEYVLAQFAIFLCGAAYLPLSDKLPDERLAYILRDAKPKLIITTEDIKMRLVLEVAQEMNADPDDWVEFFCVEDVDGIIDETNIPPHERKVVDLNINELSRGLAGPKNLAYMIYTSGTTGK